MSTLLNKLMQKNCQRREEGAKIPVNIVCEWHLLFYNSILGRMYSNIYNSKFYTRFNKLSYNCDFIKPSQYIIFHQSYISISKISPRKGMGMTRAVKTYNPKFDYNITNQLLYNGGVRGFLLLFLLKIGMDDVQLIEKDIHL